MSIPDDAVNSSAQRRSGQEPGLWHPKPPVQFDSAWPRWIKLAVPLVLMVLAFFVDSRITAWTLHHPLTIKSDVGLEVIMLGQWGQWTCSILVILAVALIDRDGKRKALAIAVALLSAVIVCYTLKGLFGRTRPWVLATGQWHFMGPAYGFGHGASYESFPSAHASGAFALAAALCWFYPNARALFYGLALQVAVQRVLRNAHFCSDVIAGGTLAVVVVRSVLLWNWPGKLLAKMPPKLQAWYAPTA